jgi:2-dehydropantoate 2-reductase
VEILVFGAGAMGSFFGGLLSLRHDVTLVGRHDHMEAVRAHGLRIAGKTVLLAKPRTATRVPRSAHPELIIVATKSYDTGAAMRSLSRFGKTAVFLTLQNGLDNPDILAKSARKVVAGTTAHGVTFVRPGEIRHAGVGDTAIGAWTHVEGAAVARVRDVFEEAGIRTRIVEDVRSELWAKLVVNASINPLASLAGVPNGQLLDDPRLRRLLENVARETASVARAAGARVDVEELVRRTRLVARRTAGNRASMLQDLDRGRRTEVDAITGAVLREAERAEIGAPLNRALFALVRARESAFRGTL